MVFYKVASKKELTPGSMMSAGVGGKEILLANVEEKYYAIGNSCTHRGCKLSNGALKVT